MEVPLRMTQDEFFRHLNLVQVRHVSSAKFAYRLALKERLRASTKQESTSLPSTPKTPNRKYVKKKKPEDGNASSAPSSAKKAENSPSLTPMTSIPSSVLASLDFEEDMDMEMNDDSMTPLLKNTPDSMYDRPDMKRDIERWRRRIRLNKNSSNKNSPVKSLLSGSHRHKSDIIVRKDYLKETDDVSATKTKNSSVNRLLPKRTIRKEHKSFIRIQPSRKMQDLNLLDKVILVQPEFAVARRLDAIRHLPPQSILRCLSSLKFVVSSGATAKESVRRSTAGGDCSTKSAGDLSSSRCSSPMLTTLREQLATDNLKSVIQKSAARTNRQQDDGKCTSCSKKRKSDSTTSNPSLSSPNGLRNPKILLLDVFGPDEKSKKSANSYKCEICAKIFEKRSRIVRHLLTVHSHELHQVDLGKMASSLSKSNSEKTSLASTVSD